MTDHARRLMLKECEKIGGDPNALLEHAILNGWQKVYPIKDNGAGNGTEPKGFAGLRQFIREREEGNGDVDVTAMLQLGAGERR